MEDKKAVEKKPLEAPKAEVVKLENVHNGKKSNNGNHFGQIKHDKTPKM